MTSARSPLARLLREPRRFTFDAAVRVLMAAARTADPAQAMRFRTPPGLTFPPTDVLEVRPGPRPDVTTGLMGLTGPSGVLPRYYSELVSQTLRGGSTGLHRFLDMLGDRFVGFFARAAIKYRPARAADCAAVHAPLAEPDRPAANTQPDAIARVLLAITGYATPHLTPRLTAGTEPLLHYAGFFGMRPRSADRLGAMLSDWLGTHVEIIEFAGAWLSLPPSQRTAIGRTGMFHQLGVDASAGVRAWSPEARVLIRIGPLTRDGFQTMLPDSIAMRRLVSLTRAYVGVELGFAVNPVLAAAASRDLCLQSGAPNQPRLGWNTWLPIPATSFIQRTDAADAVFDADTIERDRFAPAGYGESPVMQRSEAP